MRRPDTAAASVDRADPARAGVKAGRVVGLLTAALAVASLVGVRATYYAQAAVVLDAAGLAGAVSPAWVFWGNVALTAAARYAAAYVAGSLIGVVYDWAGRPSLAALALLAAAVGCVDGVFAALDTRSAAVGAAYVAAWLCYVPAFAWLFDDADSGGGGAGARRLGG